MVPQVLTVNRKGVMTLVPWTVATAMGQTVEAATAVGEIKACVQPNDVMN